MKSKDDQEASAAESEPRPARLKKALLRAVDACSAGLQRLRNRIEPPLEESLRDHGRRNGAPEAQAPPRPKSLLRRTLIVVLCLLIGGNVGMLFSYRLLARSLDARAEVIDFLQERIADWQREDGRNRKSLAKCQEESGAHWKAAHEAQRQVDADKEKIDELEKRLASVKPVERPIAPPAARTPSARTPPAATARPLKSGDCTTGATNAAENLAKCLDQFNR